MYTIQTQFPDCTHIIVVDFEATCGPGVSKTDAEIIEVGAVLMSFTTTEASLIEMPTFHRYIRPTIVGTLTPFCKNLTGITQEQVDNGLLFEDMIREWKAFLSEHHCNSNTVVFGCWTDFDIKQLRRELARQNIEFEFSHWIDLQKAYKISQQKNSIQSVSKALAEQELEFIGNAHSAIHDAINTARLVPFC